MTHDVLVTFDLSYATPDEYSSLEEALLFNAQLKKLIKPANSFYARLESGEEIKPQKIIEDLKQKISTSFKQCGVHGTILISVSQTMIVETMTI